MKRKPLPKKKMQELFEQEMAFWNYFRMFDERRGNTSIVHEEALRFLQEKGDLNMADFAKLLNVTKPSATCLVNNMVKKGLITRKYSLKDRRKISIGLTKKGEEALKEMKEEMISEMRKIFCGVSEDEIEKYLDTQEKLIQNMKEIQSDRWEKRCR
jgi:DNA-binding MarR family transcriptional regulator